MNRWARCRTRGAADPSEHPEVSTRGGSGRRCCRRAAGTCFKWGKPGHMQRDCPKSASASTSGHANKKPDVSGRVFALTQDQETRNSGTITGILFILGHAVIILFDTGAIHSVVSTTFTSRISAEPVPLDHVLCLSTPMKDVVRIF